MIFFNGFLIVTICFNDMLMSVDCNGQLRQSKSFYFSQEVVNCETLNGSLSSWNINVEFPKCFAIAGQNV